jgi:hypothetical protein
MQLKIVIPSHKRHDNVITTKLVKNAIICVAESQVDLYKEHNPDYEIVAHPDSVIGLIPKRNWMKNHFGDMFMIDDDVFMFHKLYMNMGEPSVVKSSAFIENQIYALYETAKLMEVPLFGFTKNPRPEQYNVFKPYRLDQTITGCAYGVMGNSDIKWDEDFKLKEDFYISCLAKYKYRKILVDTRFNFGQKDTFVSSGGLAEIRNHDQERRDMLRMRKNFGECVTLKQDRSFAKSKVKNNITVKFGF